MAAQDQTKHFWMKIFTRFYDKHEIKLLWKKDRDYVLLYQRLMLESVPNGGVLKYDEDLAYTVEDIAALFDMPEEKVDAGLKELVRRHLISIEQDGTIVIPCVPDMSGFDTGLALRLRSQRERARVEKTSDGFTAGSNEPDMNPNEPDVGSNKPESGFRMGSNDPKDQISNIKDYNNTHSPGAPAHARKEPPNLETVLAVAKNAANKRDGKAIPEDFCREWYELMTLGGWKDTKGHDVLLNWQLKLAYAWKDRQGEMTKLRERAKANGNYTGGTFAQQQNNKIGLED